MKRKSLLFFLLFLGVVQLIVLSCTITLFSSQAFSAEANSNNTTYDPSYDDYNLKTYPHPQKTPYYLKYQDIQQLNLLSINSPVDIVFAIDNTGSMGETIDQVKSDVQIIVDNIRSSVPDSRFGSIKFQDYGDVYLTEIVSQPTFDVTEFKNGINTMYADNGGDWPEAYIEAIQQGVQDIIWRDTAIKLLVVLGDAPPHDPIYGTGSSPTGQTWAGTASNAYNAGVVVGRSRYAAEKKSKIVYNSYTCPISGTFKKGVYHESNRSKSI